MNHTLLRAFFNVFNAIAPLSPWQLLLMLSRVAQPALSSVFFQVYFFKCIFQVYFFKCIFQVYFSSVFFFQVVFFIKAQYLPLLSCFPGCWKCPHYHCSLVFPSKVYFLALLSILSSVSGCPMAQCVPTTAIKCILFKRAFLEKCIFKTCNFLVLRSLLSSVSQLSQPPFEDLHCLVINSQLWGLVMVVRFHIPGWPRTQERGRTRPVARPKSESRSSRSCA